MSTEPVLGNANLDPEGQGHGVALIERTHLPAVEVEGPQHFVRFVNAAFCRLLGKSRETLIGKSFAQLAPKGTNCLPLLEQVDETGDRKIDGEVIPLRADPSHWLYAMWPAVGIDERPQRVVIQVTRAAHFHENVAAINEALLISALKQHELRSEAEAVIVKSQAEIAERVLAESALRDVNDQLRKATGVSDRVNKAKDDFLAALSHELRTPLTPVLITAAALREDPRLPADVREQLTMIERNIALEARLIDDLLDITKISHGKLHLRTQACDAHSLVSLAVDIVREEAQAKNIVIKRMFTAHHSGLTADPARFQQVIWNLLRNAVKFTPRDGTVSVRTSDEHVTAGSNWLRIEVTDSGIGIDPAGLEQIFLPFEQGELTGDHRFGGIGLGLAIARAVVVMHGGRITAESRGLNLGSTFVVEFPNAIEPASGVTDSFVPFFAGKAAEKRKGASLRLLLVEDHAPTLTALSRLLQHDGHHVTTASNVTDALATAARNTFDLVISDLGLPDGTGTELMGKLKAAYGLRGIALSGYGMEEDLTRSSDAGFITHLVKPVAIAELRRVLTSISAPNA